MTDLNRRHRQPEIMDAPDLSPARFTETLKGLERVNAVTLSSQLKPLPEGFDMIMSTLFLHHLDEEDATSFVKDAARKASDRIIIQDLTRSRLSYWFAWLGTSVLLLNDIYRLDGRTSVEGAFTLAEARDLVRKAGLKDAEIVPRLPFRYLIRWVRA